MPTAGSECGRLSSVLAGTSGETVRGNPEPASQTLRTSGETVRGSPEPARPARYPRFGGVNLIFLISSTIWPSCTLPETDVIARTTFTYFRP